MKGNKRGGEIRTCSGAPVPLNREAQQLYLTREKSGGWREEKRWEKQQRLVKETGDKGREICLVEAGASDSTGDLGNRKPNIQLIIVHLLMKLGFKTCRRLLNWAGVKPG